MHFKGERKMQKSSQCFMVLQCCYYFKIQCGDQFMFYISSEMIKSRMLGRYEAGNGRNTRTALPEGWQQGSILLD